MLNCLIDMNDINNKINSSKHDEFMFDKHKVTQVIDKDLKQKKIFHDGVQRRYLIYLPSGLSSKESVPLVFNFHGFGDSAEGQLFLSDWRSLSEEFGFILIYPQGLQLPTGGSHWNPDPNSFGGKSSSDDLGFVRRMVKRSIRKYSVDPSRVYATGFSNGAGMAYGLAHHESEMVAAIAPVSGLVNVENLDHETATNPVGLISFNGTDDWIRPIDGVSGYLASANEASNYWANINNSPQNQINQFEQASTNFVQERNFSRVDGTTTVKQYVVNGGGHDWFDFEINGRNLDELAWDFLSDFRKIDGRLVPINALAIAIRAPRRFKRKSVDIITDFNPSVDVLEVDTDSFDVVNPANFAVAANKKMLKRRLAKQDFSFLYNQKKGELFFNENGVDKGFGDGGIIAILKGAPDLTVNNLNFV